MSLVDRHLGQRLVVYPFSPKPPEPEKIIIREVVKKPDALPAAVGEKLARQDQEITKLTREIELLTLLLKRQAEDTKVPALYLGRKVSGE
jgi:hypothetical protein